MHGLDARRIVDVRDGGNVASAGRSACRCRTAPARRRSSCATPLFATSATSSMYGLSPSSSNQSATSSRSTDGANGRKDSRYLTLRLSSRLHRAASADRRGSSGAPSARGPNSMRPWNQPSACPSASASARALDQRVVVEHVVNARRRARKPALDVGLRRTPARDTRPACRRVRVDVARLRPVNVIARRAPRRARRRHRPPPAESRCARSARRAGPCRWRRS